MAKPILADAGTDSRAERALRLFEERGQGIQRIAAGVYRVPSCSGTGSYDVLYGQREECPCPDYQYGGGRPCKHLIAVGIMHAARRSGVREVRTVRVAAGDGFAYRAKSSCHCYGGYHYIGVEEDGEEHTEVVPCKRCHS
jgi:SWIM zinc finger